MKKIYALIMATLMAVSLTTCTAGLSSKAAAEAEPLPTEYIGVVYNTDASDAPEGYAALAGDAPMLYLSTLDHYIWLALPEVVEDLSAYSYAGVRLTMDEGSWKDIAPFSVEDTFLDGVLHPTSVEIIGEVVGSNVVRADDTSITVLPYGANSLAAEGEEITLQLTEESIGRRGDPPYEYATGDFTDFFLPGMGCELMFDVETQTVISAREANG